MIIEESLVIRLSEYLSTVSSAASSSMIGKKTTAGKDVNSSFTFVPEVLTVDGCAPGPSRLCEYMSNITSVKQLVHSDNLDI